MLRLDDSLDGLRISSATDAITLEIDLDPVRVAHVSRMMFGHSIRLLSEPL